MISKGHLFGSKQTVAHYTTFRTFPADFISTGEINPVIYKDIDVNENWQRREIEYLDGTKVKLQAGYFAVTLDDAGNGYHIAYQCNEYKAKGDKHEDCSLVLGAIH